MTEADTPVEQNEGSTPEPETPTTDAAPDDAAEASASSDEAPKKKRRRRRRRKKKSTDGGEASADGAERSESEDADDKPAKKKPAGKAKPRGHAEDWEELFGDQTFADLGLRSSVVKSIDELGFKHPTKIQAMLIPAVIEGDDVIGQAKTGSGKTAAFALPLFHLAKRAVPFQTIILAPTRELAIQITSEMETFGRYTPIRVCAVYGGQRITTQAKKLEEGPEIIVATPGRLMDLHQRRMLHFNNVRFAVLDEVDRMLDIGFRDEIRRILSQMKSEHQTVFVSATISKEIESLARRFMKNPKKIVAAAGSLTVNMVDQFYISVEQWDKKRLLHHVLATEDPALTIVFCRMKRTVDDLTKFLKKKKIDAHAIHGDMYQGQRNTVMQKLRDGQLRVVVASDLAARGLDIENITHVINFDLPEDPEVYIHRIGRTARAGRRGVAWSLVTPEEGRLLTEIEKLANIHIPDHGYDDFEPGQVPDNVAELREREKARVERMRNIGSRFSGPTMPAEEKKVDPSKFPGGVVPTKLPPKRMGGRVRTTRGK